MEIYFTEKECNSIIAITNYINKIDSIKYFTEEGGIRYNVWNIKRTTETQWIFNRLFEYFTYTTGIKIIKPIEILHIHKYVIGDKFKKHTDTLYPTQIHNIGACLNDGYAGGDFILYEPDYVLPKEKGKLYTFKGARPHEVTEILNGERWSIIAFLHLQNIEIQKKLL